MKTKLYLLFVLTLTSFLTRGQTQTMSFNTPGNSTFTVPCGVTQITIECWGAGGGGQKVTGDSSAGGGGSGGGYVKGTLSVLEGATYSIFIGTGGSGDSGVDGQSTWFNSNTTFNAVGGKGAGATVTTNSTYGSGATAYTSGNYGGNLISSYGGNGGNAGSGSPFYSGGSGSSAGSTASGNASGKTGGIAPTDGYAGVDGITVNGVGINGNIGSGGSGARKGNGSTTRYGGDGGNGQIRISWVALAYCNPIFANGIEPITNVSFGSINNTSSNTSTSSLEKFCYSTNVTQGTNYNISLKGNTVGNYADYFTVFVDWNQDGDFIDSNEVYYLGSITNSTGVDAVVLNATISVPLGASLGKNTMRVIKYYNINASNPCLTSGYGQAEDYVLHVEQLCPQDISIIQNDSNVCSNSVTFLNTTGVSSTILQDGFNVFSSQFNYSQVSGTFYAYSSNYYIEGNHSLWFNTSSSNANGYLQSLNDIDLNQFANVTLSFSHICATEANNDYGYVEYSVDNGTNWISLPISSYSGTGTLKNGVVSFDKSSYTDWNTQFTSNTSTPGTTPATSLWKSELITLPASALTSSDFRFRFRYTTSANTQYYGWLIDDVKLIGENKTVWLPITTLYNDVDCTIPYTLNSHAINVYAKPSTTTTYTASTSIGSCSKTDSVTLTVQSTTYNGSWTPALTNNQSIEINADYTLATDMDVCACKVNSGKKLTVPSATTLTVQNGIDNAGEIVVDHTGSLVQVKETNTNTGAGVYKIKKTTGGYYQYDYIYWSSPIENQNIENVFKTTDGFSNYKYKFVPQAYNDTRSGLRTGATQPTAGTADGFDDEGNDWTSFATGTMEEGLGYIVMGKGSVFPFSIANASNAVSGYNVEFSGNKVNNGAVNITLYKDAYNTALPFVTGFETKNINLNLVGNPYPSSISTAELYADNSALIEPNFYFWTHAKKLAAIGGPYAYDFSNDSFASATVSGGVVTTNALATGLSGLDYEYIASGQGFFVQAKNGITSGTSQLTFNNSMRGGSYPNTSFLKTNDTNTLSRIWLSLTEGNGNKNNIAVGFSSSATDGYGVNDVPRIDSAIDTEFYSLIAGENGDFDIQFMSDFAIEKTIPLGLEILTTDTYIISLEGYEGIFTQDQKIYLEDTYLDVIHNLNEGPYTFTQSAGNNINDRFILRFTNTVLGNEETVFNQVKVYPNPSAGVFNIAYYGSETLQYTIYDLTGKTVMSGTGNQINLSQQAIGLYFAKITDGSAVRTLKLVRE